MSKKKRPWQSKEEHVAYHEAAHVVAAYVLRRAFRSVTIEPDGKSLGVTWLQGKEGFRPDQDYSRLQDRRAERGILISFAGVEAEYVVTGRRDHRGAAEDYRDAIDYAVGVTGSEKDASKYLQKMRLRAADLIRPPARWRAVEALAKALLSAKTIKGREARRIIGEAML